MIQQTIFGDFFDNHQERKERIKQNTYICDNMSEHRKRILRYGNLHLSNGMIFTDENGFAQILPYNGDLPVFNSIFPYTERKGLNGHGQGLHFFVTDYQFANPLWDRLYQKTLTLSKFDLLFAPDYSLFANPDYQFTSKEGIYRSRFIASYWQQCGLNVVPTASWGDVNSFKYCFEGLPDKSIVAVGNETVHINDHSAVTLWQWGVQELVEQKDPTLIIVYEKHIEIPGIQTPVQYIDGYIKKHFRNGR